MAVPTYGTDLTLIDDAQDVTSYSATGGGASGLNDETDYFINGAQCVSKNGFTATTKGMLHDDVTAPTIAAGDAVFMWARQANRNILDTIGNGGGQLCMGTSATAFAAFDVDGSDVDGSVLLSWVNYAVDPTQTASRTTGSPGAASTWDHFGMEWKILGTGSLKGAPNAIGIIRHGRELTVIDGQASEYGTFAGAAAFDSDTTRRWGILTEGAGALQFHGAFVMGTTGTAVDFRDPGTNIIVLEDPHVPSTFNEFEIRNASSNVEWTGVSITALGTTSPFILTLNVGTFTGTLCKFVGGGTTVLKSDGAMTLSTWEGCQQVTGGNADLSGSSILASTVAADAGALLWNETISTPTTLTDLADMTFSQGTNAHHAIQFGTNVTADVTLTGVEFSGFSASDDVNGSTLRFDATTGSLNVNLVGCTVDGSPATTSNIGVDDAAGVTVTLVIDPVTTKFTCQDEDNIDIQNVRVFAETADNGGGSGFPYQLSVTGITQTAGVATATTATAHGLVAGDQVVIRGAVPNGYNKVAAIIAAPTTTTFTYAVDSGLSSPSSGTRLVSYVAVHGLTDVNGEIQSSKTWPASQGLKGWARKKNTVSPFYKDANIVVADASGGTDQTLILLPDE